MPLMKSDSDLATALGDYYPAGAEVPAEMKFLKALNDIAAGYGTAQIGGALLKAIGSKAVPALRALGETGSIRFRNPKTPVDVGVPIYNETARMPKDIAAISDPYNLVGHDLPKTPVDYVYHGGPQNVSSRAQYLRQMESYPPAEALSEAKYAQQHIDSFEPVLANRFQNYRYREGLPPKDAYSKAWSDTYALEKEGILESALGAMRRARSN